MIEFQNAMLTIVAFTALLFAAATLAYVVSYCAIRGAMAGFIKSLKELTDQPSNNKPRKGV